MSVHTFIWANLLLLAAAPIAHAGALERTTSRFPELEAPPQGEARWIAKSMRLNGLPMTLKSFDSRLSAEAVLNHYEYRARGKWADESTRARNGEWQVLALKSERHYITIQVRSTSSGSHGTIAVSPLLERARLQLASTFPIPASMRIVNLQQYEDFDIESEHISLSSARLPSLEARAFAALLARDGWQLVRDQPARELARGHVLEAQKGAQHASIIIVPDQQSSGRTAAIVVWKKS